jgi:phosphoribosylglycinamide formyltransferase 2
LPSLESCTRRGYASFEILEAVTPFHGVLVVDIGTPGKTGSTKVLLCGAGELAKEVIIELQRFGVECVAVDRYAGAPGMQVAHKGHVISMLDAEALRCVIELEKPDFIVPEIEAILTATLVELEQEGFKVIPTARAAHLTMNREGIRRLAAEKLLLKTSPYQFADSEETFRAAVKAIGLPCVVKPIMSSSGKGQSVVRDPEKIDAAWQYAQSGSRAGAGRVIVEGFVPFDYEITLLTVRHAGGTSFCEPIGHLQIDGDYRESWQPHPMPPHVLKEAQRIASVVTDELGGYGIFGVELFVDGEEVYFSEVSPRPHDTGLVTLISQDLSEFALHARALLGLPIPAIHQYGPAASCALLVHGDSREITFCGVEGALTQPGTAVRLFGKPEVSGHRRMGVTLALDETVEDARVKARTACDAIEVRLG